jgi:integrase
MASIVQTGPRAFRVQVRRKGVQAITRTFPTRREAEQFGRRVESDIEAGRAPALAGGVTVADVIDAYRELRDASPRPIRSQSNEHYMLRHLADALGLEHVEALTPKRLAAWARTRRDEGAGGYTIGMELSKLGTALKYSSITLHQALPDVVAAARPMLLHLQLIGPGTERDRRLAPGEETRLLAVAPPWLGDVIRFALASAMRRGEIVRLQWDDLDAAKRLVLIRDRKDPRRKTGNDQWVPLLALAGHDAWEIVQRQPRADARIFPLSAEKVTDAFGLVCSVAGIDDLHLHDLRHEATSRLFEAGMSIEQVALVTGHKNWKMLQRYTQLRPESLHRLLPSPGTSPCDPQRPGNRTSGARRPGKSAAGKSRR